MLKRGRPEMNDRQNLEEIADLLIGGKARSPRNAISKVVGTDDSTIRRLQRKWRESGPLYMKKAKEKRDARSQEISMNSKAGFVAPSFTGLESAFTQLSRAKALQDLIDPPAFKAAREAFEASNSIFKALRDTLESSNSSFKALKQFAKTMENSPARIFEKSLRNSPAFLIEKQLRPFQGN